MASVKDLMRRRVSTPRRVEVVDPAGATSESAPKSRVAGIISGQTKANPAHNNRDTSTAPVLPAAAVHVTANSASPPITLSAKDALAVASDKQLLESAHIDVNDTRKTLEQMDVAICGLADWRKEQAENLAKLRRQLRREENARLAGEAARRKPEEEIEDTIENVALLSELSRLKLKRARLEREQALAENTGKNRPLAYHITAPSLSKEQVEELSCNPLADKADLPLLEQQLQALRLQQVEASAMAAAREDIRQAQAKAEAEVIESHEQMLQDAGAVEDQLSNFQTDLDDILNRFESLATVDASSKDGGNEDENVTPFTSSEGDDVNS